MLQKFPAFVGLVPIEYAKADVLHVERDAVSGREKQEDRAKQSEDETHFIAREVQIPRHAKAQMRESQLRAQLGALTPARAGAGVERLQFGSRVAEAFAPVRAEDLASSR